jgi:6-phosphogluconolactonase
MARKLAKLLVPAIFCALPVAGAWADGAVYAMTNAFGNNQVLAYHRDSAGNLSLMQTIATGGGGSGLQLAGVDSLGSAGSIQLDPDHRLLFVVNTESANENNGSGTYNSDCKQGTITSFRVAEDGSLTVADRIFSGGLFPNSLSVKKISNDGKGTSDGKRHDEGAENADLVYVLNAGGPEVPICNAPSSIAARPNITGFTVNRGGQIRAVGSAQAIDPGPASGTGENCPITGFMPAADFQCGLNPPSFPRSPAQARFTPDGKRLVVTVKGTNTIYVFPVGENGRAGNPTTTQAASPSVPSFFGLTFDKKGRLLVTELFGSATSIPTPNAGAVSSFTIAADGNLFPISSHVNDGGFAACWIALEPITGKFAYVANNLSAGISSYSVADDGSVKLLNGVAATGSGPNDLAAASEDGASFLYVVDAGTGTVGAFNINMTDGSLSPLAGGSGLPVGRSAQGLAAF